MTEVRKRTGKKEEKSIKSEKSNIPENDSKSKIVQIGKIQSNVSCVQNWFNQRRVFIKKVENSAIEIRNAASLTFNDLKSQKSPKSEIFH